MCVISRVSVMYNRRGDAGRVFCPFNFSIILNDVLFLLIFFFFLHTALDEIKINFYYKRKLKN